MSADKQDVPTSLSSTRAFRSVAQVHLALIPPTSSTGNDLVPGGRVELPTKGL